MVVGRGVVVVVGALVGVVVELVLEEDVEVSILLVVCGLGGWTCGNEVVVGEEVVVPELGNTVITGGRSSYPKMYSSGLSPIQPAQL